MAVEKVNLKTPWSAEQGTIDDYECVATALARIAKEQREANKHRSKLSL